MTRFYQRVWHVVWKASRFRITLNPCHFKQTIFKIRKFKNLSDRHLQKSFECQVSLNFPGEYLPYSVYGFTSIFSAVSQRTLSKDRHTSYTEACKTNSLQPFFLNHSENLGVKILKLDLQIPHILIRKLLHLPICIL